MYNNHDTADTKHYAMVQDKNIQYFARKEAKAKRADTGARIAVTLLGLLMYGAIAWLLWPVAEFMLYTLGIFPVSLP